MRWLLPVLLCAAAPLAAQQAACTYSLSQTVFVLPGASAQPIAGSVSVKVTPVGSTCTWSFSTAASWIHIQPVIVTGNGSIPFTVDANNGTLLRQDSIAFVGVGVQGGIAVIQMAGTCTYTLSPTTTTAVVGGGAGTLQVTTGCSWSTGSNQNWLTAMLDSGNLYAGSANYGNGKVNYTVTANPCVASRSANLTVATGLPGTPPSMTLTQDGSPGNLSLSQTSLTTGPGAATGRITVTTGDVCSWSAYSDANWLQFAGASSGTGLGSFAYSVSANTGPARTGSIHVGPQTFTVTQQAAPAPPMQLTAVVNAADYASGAISPGGIVVLAGAYLGPAQGAAYQLGADGESIPNRLAGVQVFFGSTAAVLLYVSAAQINAIVPYGVAGSAGSQVQVQYQGQMSNTLTVPVQAATPGIFSQDRSGTGPGAILNQDFSLNASLSPAAIGSVIQIFATGGGVTNPPQQDGVLAPVVEPLPRFTTQPVSVTIGGLAAQVAYAGAAPGLVAGVAQINAVVPNGVAPGLAVPVVVQIGNGQSQSGLTITVQ